MGSCDSRRGVHYGNRIGLITPYNKTMNKQPMKPSDFPMAKSLFDDDGIYASNPFLKSIAMQQIEADRRARACRRAANDLIDDNGGQWGVWNISDRD